MTHSTSRNQTIRYIKYRFFSLSLFYFLLSMREKIGYTSCLYDDPTIDHSRQSSSTISHFECQANFFVAESPFSRNSHDDFSFVPSAV